MPEFSERSKKQLATCDKRLQDIFNEVIKNVDCSIICGYRGQDDQNTAYENGFSKVKFPDSLHNKYPSLAVDVIPYPSKWDDEKQFYFLAGYVQSTADRLGIKIVWGGTWKHFIDMPHYALV